MLRYNYKRSNCFGLKMIQKEDGRVIRAVITLARERIIDPARWTQKAWARDSNGKCVIPQSEGAVCWCVTGAIAATACKGQEKPISYAQCVLAVRALEKAAMALYPERHDDAAEVCLTSFNVYDLIYLPGPRINKINDELGHEAVMAVMAYALDRP